MDPFVGEIRLFAGTFAPVNWALCNGQTLPIKGNEALFSLLGTMYGGDGVTTFAIPNLQVRLAVGQSGATIPPNMVSPYPQGTAGGLYNVTLSDANLPTHTHAMNATTAAATTTIPGNTVMFAATPSGFTSYIAPSGTPVLANMGSAALSVAGGQQPHSNTMPTLCVTYIMCTNGLYPNFSN